MPAWPVQLAAVGVSVKVMAGLPPQLSVAVALPVLAGAVEAPHWSCLSGGHVTTGGVVSTKLMCWTHSLWLPQASVAFHSRSMPAWPVQLAAVGVSVKVMAGLPPQLSVAVALPTRRSSVLAPHWSCLSGGQVITGGVVSTKVMCWTHSLWLPQASVALHSRSMPT